MTSSPILMYALRKFIENRRQKDQIAGSRNAELWRDEGSQVH